LVARVLSWFCTASGWDGDADTSHS